MNILKKAAEILVLSGYAHAIETDEDILDGVISASKFATPKTLDGGYHGFVVAVDLFADTLESRQQADVVEDWLRDNFRQEWHKDVFNHHPVAPYHQWRLDRIKWCLEQMESDNG